MPNMDFVPNAATRRSLALPCPLSLGHLRILRRTRSGRINPVGQIPDPDAHGEHF